MKRHSAIIALLALAVIGSISCMPAQANHSARSRYDHMVVLRFKEKTLLPPIQLPEEESAYILDFNRRLRPFSNGVLGRSIQAADLTFQAEPFGPDVLKSRDQSLALTQLGMLATMGHFAVLNVSADNPGLRAGAVAIIGQLRDVADHFKLGTLSTQYERLAADVADPRFVGGQSNITQRYDETVAALYTWVASSYGVDGHWYFMNGNAWAGLYVLALHGDQYHTDYYLNVLNDLFHSKPRLFPDTYTRAVLRDVSSDSSRCNEYLVNASWATLQHYAVGSPYMACPRYPHWDLSKNRFMLP